MPSLQTVSTVQSARSAIAWAEDAYLQQQPLIRIRSLRRQASTEGTWRAMPMTARIDGSNQSRVASTLAAPGVDNSFPPEQSARLAEALRRGEVDHVIENYVDRKSVV